MQTMRHALLATLGALSLLAGATGLEAQSIPSPYHYIEPTQSIELHVGYVNTDQGRYGVGPESAPEIGVTYAGRFTGPLSGTLGVTLIPSSRTVYARAAGAPQLTTVVADQPAQLLLAEAGLRFQLTGARTWHRIAPYVGLAAGMVSNLSGRPEEEASLPTNPSQIVKLGPAFAATASVGTAWFLTERLSLRATAKDDIWRVNTPAGLTEKQQVADKQWTQNLGVSLGVAFHF
jgi:hypothetical protein